MTRDLQHSRGQSLQERLRARLQVKYGQQVSPAGEFPETSALLLDYSDSMSKHIGANLRAIDALRNVAKDFPGARKFVFSDDCLELGPGEQIPEPDSGTNLTGAFRKCKALGLQHLVLVTDGRPDSPTSALQEARGLKIDCFYVGPPPEPQFLRDLCSQTGGEYGKASLSAPRELASGIRERLMICAPSEDPKKGPIEL